MKEKIQINQDAIALRRRLGEDDGSPVDVFSLMTSIRELTVVFHPMSDNISGMTVKDNDVRLIAVNSEMSVGRQRFTAAHELCHLFFHNQFQTIVCSKDLSGNRDVLEREADQFASYFLAPYGALRRFIQDEPGRVGKKLTIEDVIRIEQFFGMSHQATLIRLKSEGLITQAEAEAFGTNVILIARKLGFSTELYLPTPIEKKYRTTGSYLRLADELREKERISSGKYEELLLDAFRADIVYGDGLSEEAYD